MYEIIIDCTNKCISKCKNCGTDSQINGEQHISFESLERILRFSKHISAKVYLGGGCFFCHPQWKNLLELNKELAANIIIDVPLDRHILEAIQQYTPSEYKYSVSVSLWGIADSHNKLSGTSSFHLLESFKSLLHDEMMVSFVITKELISTYTEVINFINNNPQIKSFYFHRLMPTGRCLRTTLPKRDEILIFQGELLSLVNDTHKLRFHHTILDSFCRAFQERLYIDYYGDVYGCGWVSSNTKPIANINLTELSTILNQIRDENFNQKVLCPLLG